jgi:tight adherence protein C
MNSQLTFTLVAVFIGVAMMAGLGTSAVLSWAAPGRKRLRTLSSAGTGVLHEDSPLFETPEPSLRQLSKTLPKSPKDMGALRRRLASAGHYSLTAAVYYSAARTALPLVFGGLTLMMLGAGNDGLMLGMCAAGFGYMLPRLAVLKMARKRARAIEHGLPDALDLLIVCIEAGSGLDQSIMKAADELDLAHPALAEELRMITTEIRAGLSRMDAFKNFAARTQVEDVRSLVTMLIQTDQFGTSVAQALRIHAETSRTRRRQGAEERAAKVGVKLVFPLVLCIFPSVYVVCLGPVVVAISHALL